LKGWKRLNSGIFPTGSTIDQWAGSRGRCKRSWSRSGRGHSGMRRGFREWRRPQYRWSMSTSKSKGSGGSRRRLISNYTAHFLPPQSLFLARLPLHGAMFKRRLPTFCKDDSCRSRFPLQAANHGGDRNPGNEGDRPCRETTATPLVRTSLLFASLRHMEQYSRTFFPLFVRMIRNLLGYRSRERITRYLSKT